MKPARILVVDDNRDFLELTERYLRRCGWKVSTASDAQQCGMEIRRNSPDVILADILLGNEDGVRLVKAIKEDREYNRIPVIATTGLTGAVERMRCFKAGCDDVLLKPFSPEELRCRLDFLVNSAIYAR